MSLKFLICNFRVQIFLDTCRPSENLTTTCIHCQKFLYFQFLDTSRPSEKIWTPKIFWFTVLRNCYTQKFQSLFVSFFGCILCVRTANVTMIRTLLLLVMVAMRWSRRSRSQTCKRQWPTWGPYPSPLMHRNGACKWVSCSLYALSCLTHVLFKLIRLYHHSGKFCDC